MKITTLLKSIFVPIICLVIAIVIASLFHLWAENHPISLTIFSIIFIGSVLVMAGRQIYIEQEYI